MKKCTFLLFCSFQQFGISQVDESSVFNRISETMKTFQIDTSAVPNDKMSEKIKVLRALKGGFNINEAMDSKIAEARSKNEITEIEYKNIKKFLSWSIGGGGGGFCYQWGTNANLGIDELEINRIIKIVPNPVSDHFQIFGLKEKHSFEIYEVLGAEVQKGISWPNEKIMIPDHPRGMYILKIKDAKAMKFIKI